MPAKKVPEMKTFVSRTTLIVDPRSSSTRPNSDSGESPSSRCTKGSPPARRCLPRFSRLALLLAITMVATSCTHIRLVADYDQATRDEILVVARRVDVFYARLEETPETARLYGPFADEYIEVEADLQSLLRRNKARSLNDESIRINVIILDFWKKYRARHRQEDKYPAPEFDKERFDRLFDAAMTAEAVKQLKPGDQPGPGTP